MYTVFFKIFEKNLKFFQNFRKFSIFEKKIEKLLITLIIILNYIRECKIVVQTRMRSVANARIHSTRAYKRLKHVFERAQIFKNLGLPVTF